MSPRRLHEKPSLYIFHLSRTGARPEFLHSLKAGKDFIPQTESGIIRGRYGKEPRIESLTLLRGDLYRMRTPPSRNGFLNSALYRAFSPAR